MTLIKKRLLQSDIKNFILSDNITNVYRENLLDDILEDYFSIVLFLLIALILSCGFIFLNFMLSPSKPDPEKLSPYECGFEPFNDSRMEFDVRFYLVAILFIIFDLEIAFFFCLHHLCF